MQTPFRSYLKDMLALVSASRNSVIPFPFSKILSHPFFWCLLYYGYFLLPTFSWFILLDNVAVAYFEMQCFTIEVSEC